ncbi:MAG: endo-1,4-beta-xylanase [Planctomycetota bacterium]
MFRKIITWPVLAILWLAGPILLTADELVLSEFNGTGFDYTFSGFEQTTGANSVRVFDPFDDSGGAGVSQSLNLASHAGSRFVVDVFTNSGNQVDFFDLELIDTSGRKGKWSLGVSDLTPGVASTLVATTTLDTPTHGIGGFNNLDLSNITTWQVLGSFSSSNAFDINFDRIAISDMVAAPPAYPGAEADAPWRGQAAARIDANRKAELRVNVTDALGNAINGANVSVQMKEHEFGFGSAVQAFRLRTDHPQHDPYKQKTTELFNLATIENNLKWPPWEGEWGGTFTQSGAQSAINWLASENIDVRGHALVWPGYSNLPQPIKNLLDSAPLDAAEQAILRAEIADHIADIAGTFAGQLAAWDVVNEERANHDIMDNLPEGDLAMVDWFAQAQAADPNSKRYINDFGILTSAGGTNTSNQQEYFNTIQALINEGAPIDGIGFQSHYNEGSLTGPEQLWTILDNFQTLGLDMQITEFDFTTTDEQLQADYTRDFLTAIFAHEGIDDFVFWGFWEDAHWRPDAALFRSDWSIKPNGQAYLDLVFDEWWTNEVLATSNGGATAVDGFKGEYEITVEYNGESQTILASLTNGGLDLEIALSTLSADFDGDGDVDNDDLVVWSTNLGTLAGSSQSSGDADGDGDTDAADFLLWQTQQGTSLPSTLAAIPEPSTVGLAAFAVVAAFGWRKY